MLCVSQLEYDYMITLVAVVNIFFTVLKPLYKNVLGFCAFICFTLFMLSCNINSNGLPQEKAEKVIRDFLAAHAGDRLTVLSPTSIAKIEKANIYSQFNTSVTVNFRNPNNTDFRMLFGFTKTAGNKWFLQSVEGRDNPSPEILLWQKSKKKSTNSRAVRAGSF